MTTKDENMSEMSDVLRESPLYQKLLERLRRVLEIEENTARKVMGLLLGLTTDAGMACQRTGFELSPTECTWLTAKGENPFDYCGMEFNSAALPPEAAQAGMGILRFSQDQRSGDVLMSITVPAPIDALQPIQDIVTGKGVLNEQGVPETSLREFEEGIGVPACIRLVMHRSTLTNQMSAVVHAADEIRCDPQAKPFAEVIKEKTEEQLSQFDSFLTGALSSLNGDSNA